MTQLLLPLTPAPRRWEIGGAWYSTFTARWYVGPTCTDLSWPVWRQA